MTKVLVTGAAGFIGKRVVACLEKKGAEVVPIDIDRGDVCEPSTWASLPKTQAVIHLAGRTYVPSSWSSENDFLRTNVLGTEQAISYCTRYDARLVFASTHVYGVPLFLPITEEHPSQPNNPYALSKHLAEELCEFSSKFHGVAATILRVFNVFGAGQREEFLIPTILNQLKNSQSIHIKDIAPRRDYIYVEDVAEAFALAALGKSGSAVLNIGSGVSYAVGDVIQMAQKIAGKNLQVLTDNETRPNEIPDVIADISRAKKVLDWAPRRSFEEGLKKTWEEGFSS